MCHYTTSWNLDVYIVSFSIVTDDDMEVSKLGWTALIWVDPRVNISGLYFHDVVLM